MREHDRLPIIGDGLLLRRVLYIDRSNLLKIYSNPEVVRYQLYDRWTADRSMI